MFHVRGFMRYGSRCATAAAAMRGRRVRVLRDSVGLVCQRLCITTTPADASSATSAVAAAPALSQTSGSTASSPAAASAAAASARDKVLSSTPLAVAYPARQNPFVSALQAADTRVLLANSQYAIFSVAYDRATGIYAVYSATSNQLVTVSKDYLWKAAMWADERIGEEYIAGLFFGTDASAPVREAVATLVQKTQKRTVQAPDAWGIAYLAFRAQREVVPGVVLPTSLEHAFYLLSHKIFDPALLETTIFDINAGSFLRDGEAVKEGGVARTALLSWAMLLDVHRRFGTPGSRKSINPIEQIIRRVVKAVSIFVIDIDVRVGRGTIAEGHTMSITIYDAQRRSQSVHAIRSLSEEVAKLNHLTTLLYGEGSSSITLFIPTLRTRAAQTIAFARTCRPKSPFFVVELSSLSQHLGVAHMTQGLTATCDPRTTWARLRTNCVVAKCTRKEEDRLDRHLQREFTALANKLFNDRLHKVAPAIQSAIRSIPAPESDAAGCLAQVRQLAKDAEACPVTNICHSTFLNKVNVNDAEVVFRLQRWRAAIYDGADRLARETAAAATLQRYLVVDLETTTVRRYKRIANPFTRENYVVLSGARDYEGKVFMPRCYFDRHVALRYDDPAVTSVHTLVAGSSQRSLFLPPLQDYDVLVGHNIKFDLLHMWRDAELRQFLLRGGRIWDTMYAEYLLSGQEVKLGCGAGLEDVARSYGGQIAKLDAVKRAWAEGKETYEIPYPVLCEYLHGDLENTELIFRKQCARALQQRQVIICNARMDGLLCTTEMEYNGLKTNVELAQRHTNELTSKSTELRRRLEDAIPGEIPPDCRKFFNWSSNAHLIYLFFGGKLKLSTNARESRTLPGEVFARHELFAEPDSFPTTHYPRGVFLRPPIHVLGVGDCAVLAGVGLEKGTRMFRAYFDAYMRQAGFRKSSTLADSFRRMMVAVPRSNPERRGEVAALANLLPRRHVFLFAALSLDGAGQIAKLFVKNAVTAESVTIMSGEGTRSRAEALRTFIRAQVRAHTEMLLAANEDTAASLGSAAFVNAQVTILARDACFSFQRHLRTDTELMAYVAAHSANITHSPHGGTDTSRADMTSDSATTTTTNSTNTTADEHDKDTDRHDTGAKNDVTRVELDDRYDIAFADTVATLAYYIHTYGPQATSTTSGATASSKATASGGKKVREKQLAATTPTSRVGSGGGGAPALVAVVPAKALPRPSKTRLGNAEALRAKLVQEANMKPEEWCNLYMDIFLHMANAALQHDALAEDASKPRAKSGRKKTAAKSATSTSTSGKTGKQQQRQRQLAETTATTPSDAETAAAEEEQQLPVLMRRRRAFVGYYNALPDAERKRLSLMCLLGRTIASMYDCFAVPCSHDDVVEVGIKGRLATYIPNELEAEQVMRRFRSSTTRQLQVGEDTLHYFENTHNDQTAKTILELRALEKLIGTYYESTDGGSGMVALVHSIDSCIHHELIHNKTNTGRLSSANPNCQNIPKEDKSSLRDMFISRYGEKGMCIEADYSQLEVVALAVLAEDEQMLDDLRHNIDFHCKRVTMMRPDLRYTEVLQRAKRNKEPDFVKLRQQAKIFSFQRQYGAGVKMISKSTGLTQDQVHMLIEKERETYRGVDVFNKMVTLSANSFDASLQNGAKNVRGHQFFKGLFPVLTGSRYIFTESDIPESMMHSRYSAKKSTNFSPTHLKNYPVQGFAGEIVQIMLGVLWRHFLKNNNYNSLAVLNNTVHDCVWVDCHESIYRTVAKDVEEIMTNVRKVVNGLFPEINITVDFPCDVMAGESMGSLRAIIEETTL